MTWLLKVVEGLGEGSLPLRSEDLPMFLDELMEKGLLGLS